MISRFINLALFAVLTACSAGVIYSQPPELPEPPDVRRRPRSINGGDPQAAMMAKLRSDRDKKDHQEMLDRGEQALRLANQLQAAFEQNKNLTPQDRARLEALEEVVEKIRKELGGNDDGDDESLSFQKPTEEDKPSTMEDALKFLRSTTVKLVDELKKTTRFSISAIAIQSSNNSVTSFTAVP